MTYNKWKEIKMAAELKNDIFEPKILGFQFFFIGELFGNEPKLNLIVSNRFYQYPPNDDGSKALPSVT